MNVNIARNHVFLIVHVSDCMATQCTPATIFRLIERMQLTIEVDSMVVSS